MIGAGLCHCPATDRVSVHPATGPATDMPLSVYVVASADNSPYMAWQAKLFHYSCVTYAGMTPLVVVHGSAQRPLLPDYEHIVQTGGVVCRAGSFRESARIGDQYAPRNTPGTLLSAAELCEDPNALLVLCDADMLFLRQPAFPLQLSGDYYNFVGFDEPRVLAAARAFGVTPDALAQRGTSLHCGVPHAVPAVIARPFAETWLDVIDAFPERGYIDSMHAFGIAAAALELEVVSTRHMVTNYVHEAPADADMIHYGYGDARWNKRDYVTAEHAGNVWTPPAELMADGTILGTIVGQLREARAWYAARGVPGVPAVA